jgi:separase
MDLFYLQDFANTIPFHNDKLLNHTSSGVDDLLPKSSTISTENTDFKLLSTNFNVDLNLYLPENWAILSIDFCQTTGNLLISKYTKGRIPLFLNLPLRRYNSRKIEVYSFLEVVNKFNQLIKQSNTSTKSSITSKVVTKADRKEWWKLRFSLDLELKELLQHVEDFWFGGFKTVFNNVESDTVFNKFRNDFIGLLNKLLPSRRQSHQQFMQFDDNLISLFYDADMNDKSGLDDLVYFLIDSLNLHGEVNNFDDIPTNFTESIQKLIDKYHNIRQPLKKEHVVLIPGSKCLFFPWESMDCLRNKSVSRVPSVSMLLDILKQRNGDMKVNNQSSTYYLINPGGDLFRTEQRFKQQFTREKRWSGLIGREPQEDQHLSNLLRLELFVYLGHGGCDQYMTTSTLYRACLGNRSSLASKLPPSLLIGCSSGTLQTNGSLEPNGNVYNWLTCGSPMIMANLWDVTDKDIDLFARSIFEKWGLFNSDGHETICSAVKKSRDICTLKYLNGSAPVVYGLPLVLN